MLAGNSVKLLEFIMQLAFISSVPSSKCFAAAHSKIFALQLMFQRLCSMAKIHVLQSQFQKNSLRDKGDVVG